MTCNQLDIFTDHRTAPVIVGKQKPIQREIVTENLPFFDESTAIEQNTIFEEVKK